MIPQRGEPAGWPLVCARSGERATKLLPRQVVASSNGASAAATSVLATILVSIITAPFGFLLGVRKGRTRSTITFKLPVTEQVVKQVVLRARVRVLLTLLTIVAVIGAIVGSLYLIKNNPSTDPFAGFDRWYLPAGLLTLALVVVAVFYALLSWRSFVERERSLEQLRPFVSSEHLLEDLVAPASGPRSPGGRGGGKVASAPSRPIPETAGPAQAPQSGWPPASVKQDGGRPDPFIALCHDLLGASVGYLVPVGPQAELAGGPRRSPPSASPPAARHLGTLAAQIVSSRPLCLPIESANYGGASWAIGLWSERGLMGILLLGEKRDGSLYTQEEIEIARAAGERLLDARAARELARRLLLVQRTRLADEYLQDVRVRRALHDDVLPLLHTALLLLSARPATAMAQPQFPLVCGIARNDRRL